MVKLLLSLLLLPLGFGCPLFASPVAEGGVPKTVKFENVFPHVVFGQLGRIRYSTDLVFINPDSRPALLEVRFYYPSGKSAHELFLTEGPGLTEGSWSNRQGFCPGTIAGVFEQDGRLYRELPAHSVAEFALPGTNNSVIGKEFDGWIVARSNSPLTSYERIRMIDDRGFSSHVEVLGSSGGTRGEIDLIYSRTAYSTGVQRHVSGGIAFANPGIQDASLKLTLTRIDSVLGKPYPGALVLERTLQVPGRRKQTFFLDELFTPLYINASYRLTVDSENRVPLAMMGIGTYGQTDLHGNPLPNEVWLTIASAYKLKLPQDVPFSLPEELITQSQLADWALSLTPFGFIALRPGSSLLCPINLGCAYSSSEVVPDNATGIAVVHSHNETGLFFGKSGRLLTLGYGMPGRRPVFRPLADPNLVEIEMGTGCPHSILTVDLSREEVVSKRRGSDYCWFL